MPPLSKEQAVQEKAYEFPYHYMDLASNYHKIMSNGYLDLLNVVKEFILSSNKNKILEVGCGDGRLCYEIKNSGLEIVGVDYSERAINFAKLFNPNIKFYIQNIENLDLNEKFDIIICMEILEHFIPKKIPNILSNISKVLKKDGKLIITVPTKNLPLSKKHYQHFTPKSLAKTLKPYFEIEEIKGYEKRGIKKLIYNFLRVITCGLLPFNTKFISIENKLISLLRNYYKKNLSIDRPEKCNGLIAECIKYGTKI